MHANSGNPCDDGNACTGGDVSNDKACAGQAMTCNDDQPCTTDSCNPGSGCVFSAHALPCSDANACTLGDACQATSGCSNTAINSPCDDGSGCTVGDTCQGGTCTAGAPKYCGDENPCTKDGCDLIAGSCTATPEPDGTRLDQTTPST